MLSKRSVVIDLKGFRYKKYFIVKELAITTSDYSDPLKFLPPVLFNSLPKAEQKAYKWLTYYLHKIHWESGDYLYLNLNQIIQIFVVRKPNAVFYTKEKETIELLANFLDREVVNLDELCGPRNEILLLKNYLSCNRDLPTYDSRNHCALKKTKAFFDWLTNEQQRKTSKSEDVLISKFNVLGLDDTRE